MRNKETLLMLGMGVLLAAPSLCAGEGPARPDEERWTGRVVAKSADAPAGVVAVLVVPTRPRKDRPGLPDHREYDLVAEGELAKKIEACVGQECTVTVSGVLTVNGIRVSALEAKCPEKGKPTGQKDKG